MKQKIIGVTVILVIAFLTALAILFTVRIKQYMSANLWINFQDQNYLVFKNQKDQDKFEQISWTNYQVETTQKEDKKVFRLYKKKVNVDIETNLPLVLSLPVNLSVEFKQGWYNIIISLPSRSLFDAVF